MLKFVLKDVIKTMQKTNYIRAQHFIISLYAWSQYSLIIIIIIIVYTNCLHWYFSWYNYTNIFLHLKLLPLHVKIFSCSQNIYSDIVYYVNNETKTNVLQWPSKKHII